MCHFYGWTIDYILQMQAKTFFVMLNKAGIVKLRLESEMYSELINIAAVPSCTADYAEKLRGHYLKRLDLDVEKQTGLKPTDPVAVSVLKQMCSLYRQVSVGRQ